MALIKKIVDRFSHQSLDNYKDQFKNITEQVTFLNHYSDLRRQFYLILNQSDVIKIKSQFWQFIHLALADEIIMRINRQLDSQFKQPEKKIYSLRSTLLNLRRDHKLITRTQYVGKHKKTDKLNIPFDEITYGIDSTFERLNKEFDEIVGKDFDYLPKSHINRDLKKLSKITKNLRIYRNKKLAHNAVNTEQYIAPKFSDIDSSVEIIVKMTTKYYLLTHCSTHALNFSSPNFTGLFTSPWISSSHKQREILDEFDLYFNNKSKRIRLIEYT